MADNVRRSRGTIGFRGVGVFGGYTVTGFHYCNEQESLGWHITSEPSRSPIHDYWVYEDKFYGVKIASAPHPFVNAVDFEILDRKDPTPEEAKAITEAIAKWNKEIEASV